LQSEEFVADKSLPGKSVTNKSFHDLARETKNAVISFEEIAKKDLRKGIDYLTGPFGRIADPRSPSGGGGPGYCRLPGPVGIGVDLALLLLGLHPAAPTTKFGTVAAQGPPVQTPAAAADQSVKITAELLKAADATNTDTYYKGIVDAMNKYAQAYSFNTKLRVAHFLAQIGTESSFRIVEENGSYTAKRMCEIFGCKGGSKNYDAASDDCNLGRLRDKLWSQETTYTHNSKNLLSYAYASRMGNGDEASGDGYKYRGRGMIQLTGKDNYRAFTNAHNSKNPNDSKDFVANPDLLITSPEYGIESAFYYWDSNGGNAKADTDDVNAVTLAVNGGYNGLADRKARLENVKKLLGV
jgi:predicted chitinase